MTLANDIIEGLGGNAIAQEQAESALVAMVQSKEIKTLDQLEDKAMVFEDEYSINLTVIIDKLATKYGLK